MAKDKKTESDGPKATVLTEFRDINDFDTLYEVGDDVSHFAAKRLSVLAERGIVEVEKPAAPAPPAKPATPPAKPAAPATPATPATPPATPDPATPENPAP